MRVRAFFYGGTTPMRPTHALFLSILPLAGCAATSAPAAQFSSQYDTRVSLVAGYRSLDGDFSPVEDQLAYGVELDVRQPGEWLGFELGLYQSTDSSSKDLGGIDPVDFDGSTNEFSIGGRWYYDDLFAGFEPYIGIGLSVIWACYESSAVGGGDKDTDMSPALYGRAGLLKSLGDFAIGLEYRCTFLSDLDIDGQSTSADYGQLGLVFGYSF